MRLWLQGGATNQICWSVRGAGQSAFGDLCAASTVNDGRFHHVVAVRETNGTGRIYLDGALAASQAGSVVAVGPAQVSVGIDLRSLELDGAGYLFNGWLDELQFYTRALTPAEALGLFQADSAGVCRP